MQKKPPDLNKVTASSASSLLIRADTTSRLAPFLSDSICLFPFPSFIILRRISLAPPVLLSAPVYLIGVQSSEEEGQEATCGLQEQALFRNPSRREDSH